MKLAKIYPKAVGMKKGLWFAGAVAVFLIMFVVIFNTLHTFSKMKHPPQKKDTDNNAITYATVQDTQWLKNTPPPLARSSVPSQAKTTPLTNATSSPSGQNGADVVNNTSAPGQTSSDNTPGFTSDELKAIAAPISSNQLIPDNNEDNALLAGAQSSAPTTTDDGSKDSDNTSDPNGQNAKKAFLKFNSIAQKDYIDNTLDNPISPYEVKATTVIPGVLVSGINSDLPGPISAQVIENVYDSRSGQNVLIPQGAKLLGLYDSQIAYGQERVLIVWQRIIYPNGQSIDLQGMPGVDVSGLAGFHDQVHNHYGKLFSSVLLISVLSAGAQLSQPQQQFDNNNNGQLSINQILAQSLGTNIANAGNNLFQKDLDIQPTLQIRQGYQFNIMVTKDMVFPGPYQGG